MTITLENITVYIAVVGFAAALARVLIVTPIEKAIVSLKAAIEKLEHRIDELDKKREEDRAIVVALQESVKHAHRRIDEHIEIFHGGVKNS